MKTNKITLALRKSNLAEDKVTERYPNGKAMKSQSGWYLSRNFDSGRSVSVNNTHDWLDHDFQNKWALQVVEVLTAAGYHAEVKYKERITNTLTRATRQMVMGVLVTEGTAQ